MKTNIVKLVDVIMLVLFSVILFVEIVSNNPDFGKYSFNDVYAYMILINSADIKSGPSDKFETIGKLDEGTEVYVISQCKETGYCQVNTGSDEVTFIKSELLSETNNTINIDVFGNNYSYNEYLDKIYDCDFPKDELYKLNKFITDDNEELQGFYYINEDFGSEKYIQALSNITSEIGIIAYSDEYAGHYNNVKIKFAVMK